MLSMIIVKQLRDPNPWMNSKFKTILLMSSLKTRRMMQTPGQMSSMQLRTIWMVLVQLTKKVYYNVSMNSCKTK